MSLDNKNRFGTEIAICKICGVSFESITRGRVKEYCSDNCRNYTKYLNAFSKTIDAINFQNYQYVKAIKSDLFSLNNHMPKKIEE